MAPERPSPLCPICPECGQRAMWLNSIMGYWECWGLTADEPLKCWTFDDEGRLLEVPSSWCAGDYTWA